MTHTFHFRFSFYQYIAKKAKCQWKAIAFACGFLYNRPIKRKGEIVLHNTNSSAKNMALGGVLAAAAVCIMCLGGLIPVNTYVSPMLCTLLLQVILNICGRRIAWAWFFAVAILSLLLCPDREAAGVLLVLGYYPILKQLLDRSRLRVLWKGLYFNASICVLYAVLLFVLGLPALNEEFRELGTVMLIVLLILGNVTFFLLDKVLEKPVFQKLGRHGK
jgi:hypothetical protein